MQCSTLPRQPPPPSPPTWSFLESNSRPSRSTNYFFARGQYSGFVENEFVLGFAETGHRIAQTSDHALLPQNDHGIEERWCDGLAHNRHACRVDQQAGFDAARFGDRTRRMIASVVVPLRVRGRSKSTVFSNHA